MGNDDGNETRVPDIQTRLLYTAAPLVSASGETAIGALTRGAVRARARHVDGLRGLSCAVEGVGEERCGRALVARV